MGPDSLESRIKIAESQIRKEKEDTKYLIFLPGGEDPSNRTRSNLAAEIYHTLKNQGYDVGIIISVGGRAPHNENDKIRDYLIKEKGVDPSDIGQEKRSKDTLENLIYSFSPLLDNGENWRDYIKDPFNNVPKWQEAFEEGNLRVIAVTDSYHMPRLKALAKKVMGPHYHIFRFKETGVGYKSIIHMLYERLGEGAILLDLSLRSIAIRSGQIQRIVNYLKYQGPFREKRGWSLYRALYELYQKAKKFLPL